MRTPTTNAGTRMGAAYLSVICSIVISSAVLAGQVRFERTYGGRDNTARAVIQTSDGGYVVAGATAGGHPDFYLLKTGATGDVVWETDFGHRADGDDAANTVVELADGRLVVVGATDRLDLGPIAGGIYVVTTDASGALLWERTFGGFSGRGVAASADGTLVVVGSNTPDGSRILNGEYDIYLVKLSTSGDVIWTRNLGMTPVDAGSSIQPAADGGYYVLGWIEPAPGDRDVILVKTDPEGMPEWQCIFGTPNRRETGTSLQVTGEGNLIIASNVGRFEPFEGDVRLILTDAFGDVQWMATLGGPGLALATTVVQAADGGFVFAGRSSHDGDSNALMVKVDAGGNQVWEREFGGARDDEAGSLQQTADGGFVLAGWSLSFTAPDNYNREVYLVKTGPDGQLTDAAFHRGDPNSSGTTDISDAIAIFGFLFLGDPPARPCRESADANNDATIDISDGIYLLRWLFTGGPEPAAPGPAGAPCGADPDPPGTPGDLGCAEYPTCE